MEEVRTGKTESRLNKRAQTVAEKAGKVMMRFWKCVEVNRKTKCWEWTGSHHELGYGQVSQYGKLTQAHRAAYEMLVGPVPKELHMDHLCRNPRCVNPSHLEPVTQYENIMRGDCPAAQHKRKTHCKRGHPLAGDNLYPHRSDEHRQCVACKLMTDSRAWREGRHPVQLAERAGYRAHRQSDPPAIEAKP